MAKNIILNDNFKKTELFFSKLKKPKIIISIINSNQKYKNKKLEDQLKRGIIKVILHLI
jgi:hypothetical protein